MPHPSPASHPLVQAMAPFPHLASSLPLWLRDRPTSTLEPVNDRMGAEAPRPSLPGADEADDSAALVTRVRAGDRQAFRILFDRHRETVARLVYRMVGPRPELEDLVQDVFVQVHRSLRDFRGESRFSTWLHRVTVNVVLMHRRAERSRPVLTEELAPGSVEDARAVQPDEEAFRRTRIGAFFDTLKEISEKKRVVFILHDLEGMTPAEIGEVVGAPVLTVRTRLFYARRELEEKMSKNPVLASVLLAEGGFAGEVVASETRRKSAPDALEGGPGKADAGGDR